MGDDAKQKTQNVTEDEQSAKHNSQGPSMSRGASEKRKFLCDRCGCEMRQKNCKVVCSNCGNRFDCSDLNIYFD